MISMCLQTRESQRGPGLWKFNDSLLNDEDYIEVVNICIKNTIEQYALPIYSHEFLSNVSNYQDIQFMINDDLFYETLLMMIRDETVRFSKIKARERRVKEKELVKRIAEAHTQFSRSKKDDVAIRLQAYKEELEDVRKPLINGLITRSRAQWHEEGEKSTKYFLGLEKRNYMQKTVTVLRVGDHTFTRTASILEKFTEDLSKKYGKTHSMPQTAEKLINENINTSLNDTEREQLDQPITLQDLTDALQKMKKGKSPGSNGYTSSFF